MENHPIVEYILKMTEIEPFLPNQEREDLERYQQSPEFRGDSRWHDWVKYLGARPEANEADVLQILRKPA
jgi:hypothetical protein